MTAYQDLSFCDYFGIEPASVLRSVGWLSKGESFATGPSERIVHERLVQLLKEPWQPLKVSGPHECDLCQFEPREQGHRNLFVPHVAGSIFVCPELILHYISAHWYQPPAVFCDAVMKCPEMRSMQYRRKLIECGWKSFSLHDALKP